MKVRVLTRVPLASVIDTDKTYASEFRSFSDWVLGSI